MHQPCPFGPSHARIINFKYLAPGDTPTPPIVAKNDPTTPITVNSGYRVVLGCLCLESGRNGTEDGVGIIPTGLGSLGGFVFPNLSESEHELFF